MTIDEKISILNSILGISGEDDLLTAYLLLAKKEILSWKYSYSTEEIPTEVPEELETVQIQAVITGFNLNGAENQLVHSENGITRNFKFIDMAEYIHNNVIPMAGVLWDV